MIQAQWTENGITLKDIQPDPLKNGWVRLKVLACGICGSDLHTYRRQSPVTIGGVPGHEVVGSIIDGPKGIPDSIYAIEPWIYCGSCDMCLVRNRHLCRNRLLLGGRDPGGLSDFIDVPRDMIYAVDQSVSPLVASISEPMAVSLRAVQRSRINLDSTVLILGGGTIGLLSALLARDISHKVAVSVRYPHQENIASALGLVSVQEKDVNNWAEEHQPDVIIETVGGNGSTLEQAVQLCRPSGRIVTLGVFTQTPAINATRLVVQEIEMIGSFIYGEGNRITDFGTTVNLLPSYREEITKLQTHQFPLNSIEEAFHCAEDKRSLAIKVTVLP